MKPLSLEKAFNIAFFEKDSFDNFLNFKPSEQVKQSTFDGRKIYEPSVKLKEYLKFINEYVIYYLSVNTDVVFSYRKGSSTFDAVVIHSSSKVFYNTDIKNFFPSINRDFAKNIIDKNVKNIPILDIDRYVDLILDFIIYDDSLPVGFATSPSFSNACLFEFDNALQFFCKERGLFYSRYSDDIIVSSSGDNDLTKVPATITGLLEQLDENRFCLNDDKTKLIRKGNKIKLLGMVILPSGKVTVDIVVKKRVEHLIYFYISDKNKFINAIEHDSKIKTSELNRQQILDKGIKTISGLLNHINTIDKLYLDKLKKKYGNATVDMFFHKNVN